MGVMLDVSSVGRYLGDEFVHIHTEPDHCHGALSADARADFSRAYVQIVFF